MKLRLLLSSQRSGSHFLKAVAEANFSGFVCSGEQESGLFGAAFATLADFLGKRVTATKPVPLRLKKTTPEDLARVVENWEEIGRMLRKTEYAWIVETPLQAAA